MSSLFASNDFISLLISHFLHPLLSLSLSLSLLFLTLIVLINVVAIVDEATGWQEEKKAVSGGIIAVVPPLFCLLLKYARLRVSATRTPLRRLTFPPVTRLSNHFFPLPSFSPRFVSLFSFLKNKLKIRVRIKQRKCRNFCGQSPSYLLRNN